MRHNHKPTTDKNSVVSVDSLEKHEIAVSEITEIRRQVCELYLASLHHKIKQKVQDMGHWDLFGFCIIEDCLRKSINDCPIDPYLRKSSIEDSILAVLYQTKIDIERVVPRYLGAATILEQLLPKVDSSLSKTILVYIALKYECKAYEYGVLLEFIYNELRLYYDGPNILPLRRDVYIHGVNAVIETLKICNEITWEGIMIDSNKREGSIKEWKQFHDNILKCPDCNWSTSYAHKLDKANYIFCARCGNRRVT